MTRFASFSLVALALALAPACKQDATPAAKPATADAKKPDDKATPSPAATAPAAPADAAAAPVATGPTGARLKLPSQAPQTGAKITTADAMEMHMDIEANGQKMAMTQSKVEKNTIEVLAATPEAMTKIRVVYGERSQQQTMNGQAKANPDPLAGHTYVVEAKDGKISATREGHPASADESAELEREWKSLGQQEKMAKLMASREFVVGERVALTGDEMKALMDDESDKSAVVDAAITLTGVEGAQATFSMEMTFQVKDGPPLSIPLRGTVVVDAQKGWPLEFKMEGPIKGSAQGYNFEGAMKASKTFQYQ